MRTELQKIEGQRATFRGEFVRTGKKKSTFRLKGRLITKELTTILLRNVTDSSGRTVTDHLWFNQTKEFAALNLTAGDIVQFDARSAPYEKGYAEETESDFKLSHPNRVRRIFHHGQTDCVSDLPLFNDMAMVAEPKPAAVEEPEEVIDF